VKNTGSVARGIGGMRTEIHVYGPTNGLVTGGQPALPAQVAPNAVYVHDNYPAANTGAYTLASGTSI
jgi:hypothetical protein